MIKFSKYDRICMDSLEQNLELKKKALRYHKQEKFTKAINLFLEILKRNPNDDNSWYNLGNVYSDINEYNKAIECYDKALDLNPIKGKATIFFNKGNSYLDLEMYNDAEKCYKESLKINPKNVDTLFNLAVLYTREKKFDEAIKCYKEANTIKESHFSYYNLACIYAEINDLENCWEQLRKAILIGNDYNYKDFIEHDIYFDKLRTNPQYLEILSSIQ